MSTAHSILPTAVAIKQAMDDIYEAAKEVFDISSWLDARGRLPFRNILPMLESAPTSGSADKDAIVRSMIAFIAPFFDELDSDTIYKLADNLQLRMKSPGDLHLPVCTYIGSGAFKSALSSDGTERTGITLGKDTESFASLEEIGANAFGARCYWPDSNIVSFPKLKTIGESGIMLDRVSYNGSFGIDQSTGERVYYYKNTWPDHLYLGAVETIAIKGIRLYPLAPKEDSSPSEVRYYSRHYIHFPGKTMAQVKAMTNYPKFTVGAYRYVCDDGEFQPPDQEG